MLLGPSPSPRESPPKKRELGQEEQPPQQRVQTVVPVEHRAVSVDIVGIEKENDQSRGAGQGASEQATSKTGVASQPQPKLRGEASAGTRYIRHRRLPGHPGGYSLPRSVADRTLPPESSDSEGCGLIALILGRSRPRFRSPLHFGLGCMGQARLM